MALDPNIETIINACLTNATYATDNDLTKAKAYRDACRRRLMYAEKTALSGSGAEFNLGEIRAELNEVNDWIRDRDSNTRATRTRFVKGRALTS